MFNTNNQTLSSTYIHLEIKILASTPQMWGFGGDSQTLAYIWSKQQHYGHEYDFPIPKEIFDTKITHTTTAQKQQNML